MSLKIATIGGGTFGEMHIRVLTQRARQGDVEFVGLAEINPDLREQRKDKYDIAVFDDVEALLAQTNPDAVTVATPDHLHRDLVVSCLERGLHVLVEKPMDVNVDGCRDMVAAAEAAGRLLQVDFMKRHDLYHLELKTVVDDGGVGDVQYGYAWMEDRIEVPRDWLPSWAANSSPAWFVGVHYFDLIRWIVGQNAVAVSATGVRQKLSSLGIDTYDAIQAKIMFPSGVSFTVDSAWHWPEQNEAIVNQGLKVVGTEGWMTVDSQDRGTRGCVRRGGQEESTMYTPNLGFFQEGGAGGQPSYSGYAVDSIETFVANVQGLANGAHTLDSLAGTYPSGIDGLEVTKIAVAVHESAAAGGEIVRLDEL